MIKQYYIKSAIYSWLIITITLVLKSLSVTDGNDTCTTGGNGTCITSGNDTNSYRVLVGYPGNTTDITITATHGENVTLACSRTRAWKRWTSDMNKLTKSSSHNIRIKGATSGYYNLTINSFQSSNAGMYTCGVTLRSNVCGMLFGDNASKSICNYTVAISVEMESNKPTSMFYESRVSISGVPFSLSASGCLESTNTDFKSVPMKNITLMPTSNGDKWPWTMIVAVAIGAVFLCLIITIICSIVTVACRNKKRNQRMSSNSMQVAFTGLSNNDQNQEADHEVLKNYLHVTTFEDKEINDYDFVKNIHNRPEESHHTMENMKSVEESPYSQINDLEGLYSKPNMETMQPGLTSVIPEILYDTPVKVKNESSRQHIDTITTENREHLYTQPNKVKKTSEQITSEIPADEINYEPSTDEVSDSEAPPEVPPQSADILYSAVNKT